tara:strand:+ start:2033 stop:3178 length:1146 start_codon:yes stop_codon:yes gene_type:complete
MADLPTLTWKMSAVRDLGPTDFATTGHLTGCLHHISAAVEASNYWKVVSGSATHASGTNAIVIAPKTTGEDYSDQRIVFVQGEDDGGAVMGPPAAQVCAGESDNSSDTYLYMGYAPFAGEDTICTGAYGVAGGWTEDNASAGAINVFSSGSARWSGWSKAALTDITSRSLRYSYILETAECIFFHFMRDHENASVATFFGAGCWLVPYVTGAAHRSSASEPWRLYAMHGGLYGGSYTDVFKTTHHALGSEYSAFGGSDGGGFGVTIKVWDSGSADGAKPDAGWKYIRGCQYDLRRGGNTIDEANSGLVQDGTEVRFIYEPMIFQYAVDPLWSVGYARQITLSPGKIYNRTKILDASGGILAYGVARDTDAQTEGLLFVNES